MPKETIAREVERDSDHEGRPLEERIDELSVTWDGPSENVQVFLKWFRATDATGETHERYSPSLTRHQINRMIRTLRRARDAAHGADA